MAEKDKSSKEDSVDGNNNPESQFVLGLFIVKLIVLIYDILTFPFFYVFQQPWKVLEANNRIRSQLENANDPYSAYVKVGKRAYNHYAFKSTTIPEQQQLSLKMNPRGMRSLGHREVIDVIHEVLPNGKKFNKYRLTDYKWLSIAEVDDTIGQLARAFAHHDVKYQSHVLIFAETRIEWFLSAQALFRLGAAVATLYATLGLEGIVHGINETEVEHVVTTEDLLPNLLKVMDRCPKVRKIIVIELHPGLLKTKVTQDDFRKAVGEGRSFDLIPYKKMIQLGKDISENEVTITNPKPEDVAIILYTSGSTGNPKGVIITHANFIACVRALLYLLSEDLLMTYQEHSYYGFLPLAHSLELCAELTCFSLGCAIGYGSAFTMTDNGTAIMKGQKGDLRLLQPTIMAGVPLVLDRIRKTISDRVEMRKSVFWKQLFKYSVAYKNYWLERGYDTPLLNKVVCNRVKGQVGGKVRLMLIGGAPLSPDTQRVMRAFLNIKLLVGYGSTETTAGAIVYELDDLSIGRIGTPLNGVKVRLVDWPEGNYFVTDKPNPRGELVVGGPNISQGYFKLPEQTAEAYETKDGINWFMMGDIGEVYPNGTFKIIDRKKDLVKLQFGEYVSLGKVEAELKNCMYVENVCVYGDSMHTYTIAFISPNMSSLKRLAVDLGKSSDMSKQEMCDDADINKAVTAEVQRFGTEYGLNKMEIPAKVKLCAEEWSSNTGFLTASLKINRRNVQNYHKASIDSMYAP